MDLTQTASQIQGVLQATQYADQLNDLCTADAIAQWLEQQPEQAIMRIWPEELALDYLYAHGISDEPSVATQIRRRYVRGLRAAHVAARQQEQIRSANDA
jgi:hypothetical protein